MNRYIAALFVAIAYAQETETETTEDEEEAQSTLDSVGAWFSARQEPVAFTAIAEGNPCTLDGTYGWFQLAGVQQVFIGHTVGDCDIPDGAQILTWAQIEDPMMPGDYEGFYCTIEFDHSEKTAMVSADVETQVGADVDYASWDAVVRTDWCAQVEGSEDNLDCKRQAASSWQKMALNADENYPIDYDLDTQTASATCTARRLLSTPNEYMAIKSGTYNVKSGYKIYQSVTEYDAGVVASSGNGQAMEFMFEGASTLLAGAVMLTATLLA